MPLPYAFVVCCTRDSRESVSCLRVSFFQRFTPRDALPTYLDCDADAGEESCPLWLFRFLISSGSDLGSDLLRSTFFGAFIELCCFIESARTILGPSFFGGGSSSTPDSVAGEGSERE